MGWKTFGYAKKAEAHAFAKAARLAMDKNAITVQWALDAHIVHLKKMGMRPATIKGHISKMASFFLEDNEMPVSLLSAAFVSKRLEKASETVAVATCISRFKVLKANIRFFYEQGWLPANRLNEILSVKVVGKTKQGKHQLTADEAELFIEEASRLSASEVNGRSLAALMALTMGLRASEVLNRVKRDVDRQGTYLIISKAKTEAGNRGRTIPPFMRQAMAQMLEGLESGDCIFSMDDDSLRPRANQWLNRHVAKICDNVKMRRVCTQGLRGTYGSLMVQDGVPVLAVARAMGHASPSITRSAYMAGDVEQNANTERMLSVVGGSGQ